MGNAVQARPPLLRALGRAEPPVTVAVEGRTYERITVFKHDSWAATAMYRGGSHTIVCKFNRVQSIFGLPMRWLGHALARREARALATLGDVDGIPRGCGPVSVGGKVQSNVVAHDFVDGHPLASDENVSRDFFPELLHLLWNVHRRGIAYVDLHKRENVIVGSDSRPWLIDFQVCYAHWQPRHARSRLHRAALERLQHLDFYHLAKHVRRHRPEQIASLGLGSYEQPPSWIQAHRKVAVPLRHLRRTLLAKLHVRGRSGMATSEAFPEDAVRRELSRAA